MVTFASFLSALDEVFFNQGHDQRRHPGEFNLSHLRVLSSVIV